MIDIKRISTALLVRGMIAFLLFIAVMFFWLTELNEDDVVTTDAFVEGRDFVLQSTEGPVALTDYRGKVVVLYFGYAFCPDVCPTSLGLLSLALNELTAEELKNIQALFISVDPERDTVERLKAYADAFHPGIMGITGTQIEIAEVAQFYGVMYMKVELPNSALGYAVDHSSRYYIVGRDGVLRNKIEHGTNPNEIVAILRQALKIK